MFTVATETNECYGHGDCGKELRICQEDAYHKEGKFPPLFKTREGAQKYIDSKKFNINNVVVELFPATE